MQPECLVCRRRGHGNHFGVSSCRACAAFFRRSIVKRRTYQCRRGNGMCSISQSDKIICRQCRLQKCIAVGMTPENVQLNRDVLSTAFEDNSDESDPTTPDPQPVLQTLVDLPKEAEIVAPTATRPEARIKFDLSSVMVNLRQIFANAWQPENEERLLVRMHNALETYRAKKSPRIVFLESIDFLNKMPTWKSQLYDIASWMMNCEEFASLALEQKVRLFKSSWLLWEKFERLQMTLQLFGERAIHERVAITSENSAFRRDTVRLNFGPLSDHDPESIKSMFQPYGSRMMEEVAKPLLVMNLDKFELSYILLALVWHVEGKDVEWSTWMTAETVLDRISDELHDHYTNDLKMPNYAARLTKIMEIISTVEKVQHDRSKVVELARVFDVFKFETSEKDLFVC